MQISQLVAVRRRRWRIDDIRTYEDCQVVTLTAVAPPDAGIQRKVIAPFERIEPIERPRRPRVVKAALWRRACRAIVADHTPPGGLRAVRHARIDVMPHQLEPALAILRGRACRLLLADEVGLGKTIQAGIAIAELAARGLADRVLVLTPAGLREQWAEELSTRFGLDAQVADAAALRRRAADMPIGANPWSAERIVIASLDYVKRLEVIPAVAATPWDILVVDEAHGAAGDSDRRSAVNTLASQASYVLLLTATPHSGDRQSFVSLTGLGAVDDDPLIVFRRRRSDVRAGSRRRVHGLHVRPTAAEARMHALVAAYTHALHTEREGAWLAASVLHKRAFSSAWSLAESVERRLASLTARNSESAAEGQLPLPLGDRDGELATADEAPAWPSNLGLSDAAREMKFLRELLAAARAAAPAESKLHAIRRILRRSNEPAIVFTEYRDTLLHVQQALGQPAAVLHGGLTRDERSAALDEFSTTRRRVLLATDAAGEGLNLHRCCRLVINLELPWNPIRLEQRIGRVDRIGQTRVVHAWHAIAARTGETRILDRLKDRIARARADVGAPDPFGEDEERAIARLVVAPCSATASAERSCDVARDDARLEPSRYEESEKEAVGEAQRLAVARAFTRGEDDEARARVESGGPWIMRARRSTMRASLGHRILLVWRVPFEDSSGRIVEAISVPTIVSLTRLPCVRDRSWIEDVVRQIDDEVKTLLAASTTPFRDAVERITHALVSTRLTREHAIGARRVAAIAEAFQPGLFDRRAERSHLAASVERRLADRDRMTRLERLTLGAIAWPAVPRLMLIAVP